MDTVEYLEKWERALRDSTSLKDETLPLWVRNILKHLQETVFKELEPLLKGDSKNPEVKGLCIGFKRRMESIQKKIFDGLPLVEDQDLGGLVEILEKVQEESRDFEKFEKKTLQEIESGSDQAASKFHRGMSKGLACLQDEEGNWKGTRLNTELLMQMLALWPLIEEKVQTRNQLYQILLKINGEEITGDFERIRKMLKRIGFNPAKPGRPKKS